MQSILQGMSYYAFIGKKTNEQSLLNVILESGTVMKFDLCVEELFEIQNHQISDIMLKL